MLPDTDHQDAIILDIKNVSPRNMLNAVYDATAHLSKLPSRIDRFMAKIALIAISAPVITLNQF